MEKQELHLEDALVVPAIGVVGVSLITGNEGVLVRRADADLSCY